MTAGLIFVLAFTALYIDFASLIVAYQVTREAVANHFIKPLIPSTAPFPWLVAE